MKIRLKKRNKDGIVRVETGGVIQEVLINEDLMHPEKELISVCYRGKLSSGIVDFTPDEIEKLYRTVQNKMHLIKTYKRL